MKLLLKILTVVLMIHGSFSAQDINKNPEEIFSYLAFNLSPFESHVILPPKLSELYKNEPGIKDALLDAFKPKTAVTDNYRYTYSYNSSAFLSEKLYEAFIGGSWVILGRDNFSYDNNGLLVSLLYEKYVSGTYQNSSRITWTYNSSAQVLTEISEVWSFGAWNIYSKSFFTYDANGNVLTTLFEQYFDNEMVSGTNETFVYDPEGLKIEVTTQQWENGFWQNRTRYTWDYSNERNVLTGLIWETGQWVNSTRTIDSLNSSKQVLISINERWADTSWYNYSKNTYTYVDSRIHTHVFQLWWIDEWLNILNEIFTYESYGNITGHLVQEVLWGEWINKTRYTANYISGRKLDDVKVEWDGSGWQNRTSHTYSYDSHGNAIRGDSYFWDHSAWVHFDDQLDMWYNNNSQVISYYEKWVDMTYDFFTDVNDQNPDQFSFALQDNYPNPFNPQTTINYSIPELAHVVIKIFDVTGTEITVLVNEEKPAGSYNLKWNASEISSGVYFYSIQAGKLAQTKKMILMK